MLGLVLSASFAVRLEFSPDSVLYFDIARNIAAGEGFSSYHLELDSAFVPEKRLLWPPLYPLLLASGIKLGLSALWSARLILIISYLLCLLCVYKIGEIHSSPSFGIVCLVMWLVISCFSEVWRHVWSEPLFYLLVGVFFLLFNTAVRSLSRSLFILLGIVAGLAVMCRYLGVSLSISALAGLFFLLAANNNEGGKGTTYLTGMFCALIPFIIIVGPWFYRNYLLTGRLTGIDRPASVSGLFTNISRFLQTTLTDMILPLLVSGGLIAWAYFKRGERSGLKNLRDREPDALILLSIIWIAVYALVLIYTASVYYFDAINSRLVSPIYLVLMPLILIVGYKYYENIAGEIKLDNLILGLIAVLLLGFAGYQTNQGLAGLKLDKMKIYLPAAVWIKENTPPDSLFIGSESWWVRFKTERRILELGYPEKLREIPAKVDNFLRKFGKRFSKTYLVFLRPVPLKEKNVMRGYKSLGYLIKPRYLDQYFAVYEMTAQVVK